MNFQISGNNYNAIKPTHALRTGMVFKGSDGTDVGHSRKSMIY